MRVTPRDIAILAVFSLVLVAGAALVIRRVSAPPPGRDGAVEATANRPANDGLPPAGTVDAAEPGPVRLASARVDPLSSPLAPGQVLPGYQGVAERKLFAPLIRVQSTATGGGTDVVAAVPDVDAPTQAAGPPRASSSDDGGTGVATDAGPDPGGGRSSQAKPPLAVTGFIRTANGYRVLVEDTQTKRVRVASVGEEVFGYRVREVSEDDRRVVLENAQTFGGGGTVELALGENKVVEQPQAPQPPQQPQPSAEQPQQGGGNGGGGMPSSGSWGGGRGMGGFDPNSLTPEQRARYEEYMRRRRGRD